jgi:hypothetical protein
MEASWRSTSNNCSYTLAGFQGEVAQAVAVTRTMAPTLGRQSNESFCTIELASWA